MAKRRGKSCFCAIARGPRGIEEMVCSGSRSAAKNQAKKLVRIYATRGKRIRYKISRVASSNC